MKQRDLFLASEGDAYFRRNQHSVAGRHPDVDELLREMIACVQAGPASGARVLEIGCGDGARLAWLKQNLSVECHGLEPSSMAVQAARAQGINAIRGTAESLPFEGGRFDIVVFGYSLCWCDKEDLFQIASEADRVLRSPGWLLIADFYSSWSQAKAYRYRDDVRTHKMDFRTLFTWHPDYTCVSHRISHHGEVVHGRTVHTDDRDEWVAISVLRKYPSEPATDHGRTHPAGR